MQLPPHAQLIASRADLAYLDSQSVTLPAPITALEAWRRVMAKPLPGLRWAFWLRDAISARFCVAGLGALAASAPVANQRWTDAATVPSRSLFMVKRPWRGGIEKGRS